MSLLLQKPDLVILTHASDWPAWDDQLHLFLTSHNSWPVITTRGFRPGMDLWRSESENRHDAYLDAISTRPAGTTAKELRAETVAKGEKALEFMLATISPLSRRLVVRWAYSPTRLYGVLRDMYGWVKGERGGEMWRAVYEAHKAAYLREDFEEWALRWLVLEQWGLECDVPVKGMWRDFARVMDTHEPRWRVQAAEEVVDIDEGDEVREVVRHFVRWMYFEKGGEEEEEEEEVVVEEVGVEVEEEEEEEEEEEFSSLGSADVKQEEEEEEE
ncbi:hypothetical protein EJ06DRAFT_549252 [Trichodelitschia bisporula]|uniref:Uncharacterized protein n=1 Tax=Trichodelitschia bisporula TaxID=703511 RepID=A0A6G1HUP1_9PEZI|nr:hypothetical protein EJ06DRAFT_549252 [Trichodelitschia bisporula]